MERLIYQYFLCQLISRFLKGQIFIKIIKILLIVIASIFLLIITFFQFSYEEVPYPDVTIHKVAENRYEVMFRYRVKISGNMHGPSLPYTGSSYDSVKWMYINKPMGEMDASDVVLTQYRGCKDPLYWQQDMQGSIVITENKIKFLIEMPRYTAANGQSSNSVQNYVKWEHNGEYNLENKVPQLAGLLSLNDRPTGCDTDIK